MPDQAFALKISHAAAHTKCASELVAELMTMPDYFCLEYKWSHLLQTTRNHLRRMAPILEHIYLHAVGVTYVQPELPALQLANGDHHFQEVTSPSPQNALPPGPE